MGDDDKFTESATGSHEAADAPEESIPMHTAAKPAEHKHKEAPKQHPKPEHKSSSEKWKSLGHMFDHLYRNHYKILTMIPLVICLLAILAIGFSWATTGQILEKDVTLKGGITITIPVEHDASIEQITDALETAFPDADLDVRNIRQAGQNLGIIIEADNLDPAQAVKALEPLIGVIGPNGYSVEIMGSSLGASFFKESFRAIYVSFLLMGLVVFLYFGEGVWYKVLATLMTIIAGSIMLFGETNMVKTVLGYALGIGLVIMYTMKSAPSIMVIVNGIVDFIVVIGVMSAFHITLSTAGIAALLMIVGYSVDSNILLSTKVLKQKEGDVVDRTYKALKTGMMMIATTFIAIAVALIFSQSEVIRQIMIILLIGVIIDVITTWLLNTGMLRWYLEHKKKASQ